MKKMEKQIKDFCDDGAEGKKEKFIEHMIKVTNVKRDNEIAKKMMQKE